MTLKELAVKLRKIFDFEYLTLEKIGHAVSMWNGKPKFSGDLVWSGAIYLGEVRSKHIATLDVSEYKDEDGNIDYDRCIVRAEE